YPEGAVKARPPLVSTFTLAAPSATASVYGLKTYITPTFLLRFLIWDALGNLWKEISTGVLSLAAAAATFFTLPNTLFQSVSLFGPEVIALRDRNMQASPGNIFGFGLDQPRQFDDTNFDRVSQTGVGGGISQAIFTAADSGTAGSVAAGVHQASVAF